MIMPEPNICFQPLGEWITDTTEYHCSTRIAIIWWGRIAIIWWDSGPTVDTSSSSGFCWCCGPPPVAPSVCVRLLRVFCPSSSSPVFRESTYTLTLPISMMYKLETYSSLKPHCAQLLFRVEKGSQSIKLYQCMWNPSVCWSPGTLSAFTWTDTGP